MRTFSPCVPDCTKTWLNILKICFYPRRFRKWVFLTSEQFQYCNGTSQVQQKDQKCYPLFTKTMVISLNSVLAQNFSLRQILALIHELWNIKNTRAQKKGCKQLYSHLYSSLEALKVPFKNLLDASRFLRVSQDWTVKNMII